MATVISAKDVMDLRKRTGLGMMECKQALNDAAGDVDQAIALLRERVGGKMSERDAVAGEGAFAFAASGNSVAVAEVLSETDFAARNESFIAGAQKVADAALKLDTTGDVAPNDEMKSVVEDLRMTIKENISLGRVVRFSAPKVGHYLHHNNKLGAVVTAEGDIPDDLLRGICQHLIAADGKGQFAKPIAVDEASLPREQYEAAKAAAVQEAKDSGKPEEIAEKIAAGKMKKWVDDHTLVGQVYIRELDAKKPIRDYLPTGTKLTGFTQFELGKA